FPGAPFQLVAEPAHKTRRAEYARRIILETLGVQDADFFFFEIFQTAKRVPNMPEIGRVKRERDGIDGKITAVEIFLQTRRLDYRKRRGLRVRFGARGRDVEMAAVPQLKGVGEKLRMADEFGFVNLGGRAGGGL